MVVDSLQMAFLDYPCAACKDFHSEKAKDGEHHTQDVYMSKLRKFMESLKQKGRKTSCPSLFAYRVRILYALARYFKKMKKYDK